MSSRSNRKEKVFVALDVGSSKVLCVIASTTREPRRYRILGIGNTPSSGIRNGTVNDVEDAVTAIREAVREAEFTANVGSVSRVWAAIGGQTLKSRNCTGVAVLKGREVTAEDVSLAEANVRRHALRESLGRDLLKLIPQGFACGDVAAVPRPIGLIGQKLEARMHAVYGSASNAENLKRCIQRVGLELSNYEPHPWAAAKAVLSDTEAICGAAVIDIGAQTSSLIVVSEGIVQLTDVRPWGAELMTRDLAIVLGLPLEEAEELKLNAGTCSLESIVPGETVDVSTRKDARIGGRGPARVSCSRELLAKTLRSRVKELFSIYRKILVDSGLYDRVQIVVLTGGGALLRGILPEAEAVLRKKVRLGLPQNIEGEAPLLQRPDAAVALGLIRCADEASEADAGAQGVRRMPTMYERIKTLFIGDY